MFLVCVCVADVVTSRTWSTTHSYAENRCPVSSLWNVPRWTNSEESVRVFHGQLASGKNFDMVHNKDKELEILIRMWTVLSSFLSIFLCVVWHNNNNVCVFLIIKQVYLSCACVCVSKRKKKGHPPLGHNSTLDSCFGLWASSAGCWVWATAESTTEHYSQWSALLLVGASGARRLHWLVQ